MGEAYERLGPFRLIRRLGVGGMAEAFEACRAGSGGAVQRVCIKRVLPAYAADPSFVRLFRKEAETASRLHHASIVSVLGVGEDEGQAFLVLELVDGIDLRALLAALPERRLPPRIVVYLATELAFALAYAHAGDPTTGRPAIVHRDISPSNVLLGRGGEVKLADFGLARAVDGQQVTQSGEMRGKIPYMAPEQMRGGAATASADLFSLGVLMFEALSGARPFDGNHDVETMMRILGDQRLHVLDVAADTPQSLVAIVERLLAHDPRDRFRDAHELLEALAFFGALDAERFGLADRVEARLGGTETRAHVTLAAPGARTQSHADFEGPTRAGIRTNPPSKPHVAPSSDRASSAMESLPSIVIETNEPATDAVAPVTRRRRAPVGWIVASIAAVAIVAIGSFGLAGRMSQRARESADVETAGRHEDGRGTAHAVAGLELPPSASVARPKDVGTLSVRETEDVAPPSTANVPEPRATETDPRAANPPMAVEAPTPEVSDAPATPRPAPAAPRATPRGSVAHSDARAESTLRVVVHPWGSVWIDHHLVGRAPRTISLAPGMHLVEAGHDAPLTARRVAIAPNDRRTVELDLPLD